MVHNLLTICKGTKNHRHTQLFAHIFCNNFILFANLKRKFSAVLHNRTIEGYARAEARNATRKNCAGGSPAYAPGASASWEQSPAPNWEPTGADTGATAVKSQKKGVRGKAVAGGIGGRGPHNDSTKTSTGLLERCHNVQAMRPDPKSRNVTSTRCPTPSKQAS